MLAQATIYLVIGILFVISLLIMRHIQRVVSASKEMKKIEKAASMMRIATFARLETRYEPKYGSQSSVLATVVANELFSDTSPDDTPAGVFLENHRDIIEEELPHLQDDEELLRMVHITLSKEILIRHAYGTTAEQIEETFNKLKRYGLLAPIKGVTSDKFVALANQFYRDNTSE